MGTADRLNWRRGLSLRARLFAIVGMFGVSLVVVGTLAVSALTQQMRALQGLYEIDVQQQLARDAATRNEVLRGHVLTVALSGIDDPVDIETASRRLDDDAHALRSELESLYRLATQPDYAVSIRHLRQAADAYLAVIGDVERLAASDRSGARARLNDFEVAFNALRLALDEQSKIIRAQIMAADRQARRASAAAQERITYSVILLSIIATLIVWVLARSIRRSVRAVRDVAAGMARGDLEVRNRIHSNDEVGDLARAIDRMGGNLSEMIARLRADADRDAFGAQLVEALEMVDTEDAAHEVVARAMQVVVPDRPAELLLADSSRAQLERAAEHPAAGAPGCEVESPFGCIAVRRGTPVTFPDSDALNACARMRSRPCGPISALCVPLSFMGRSLGVLHIAGPVHKPPNAEQAARLTTLGVQAGNRIGTVRAFERTQVQAATDSLTGLANRRALERIVRQLGAQQKTYAFVMADLDHFKRLNDTYGHGVGDDTLRMFADVLRSVVRTEDHPARWGGEEFAIVMPGATTESALEVLERLRREIASTIKAAGARPFTASFGVADSSMARRFDEIVRIADDALYRSKEAGRDCVTVGNPAIARSAKPRRDFEQPSRIDIRAVGMPG